MPDLTYNRVPGKIYHGGENGYAKTGIVDFPRGNSVFICVVILRSLLTSMAMSRRLVNLTKVFLDLRAHTFASN